MLHLKDVYSNTTGCIGLVSDRNETVTLGGTADILVTSMKCSPQMFICAHVLPIEDATFNETNPQNNYKCKDLTGLVLCTAGEFCSQDYLFCTVNLVLVWPSVQRDPMNGE